MTAFGHKEKEEEISMAQPATTITQRRPLLATLAVALIVLAALAAGAQGASAQEGTT